MTNVASWQQRLKAMDHRKGTSNKMIQTAMLEEIRALRKENMTNAKLVPILLKRIEAYKVNAVHVINANNRRASAERRAKYHKARSHALQAYVRKYQKELAELRK